MAYAAAAPVVESLGIYAKRKAYLVTIVETGVTGNTNEWSFTLASAGLPRVCTVRAVSVYMTVGGGNATTVDPQAGMVASGVDVYENGTAAANVMFFPTVGQIWPHSATLFGQSKANGTADTITTKILVTEGTP